MTDDFSTIRNRRDKALAVFVECCLAGFAAFVVLDRNLLPPFVGVVLFLLIMVIAVFYWVSAARAHLELRAKRKGRPQA